MIILNCRSVVREFVESGTAYNLERLKDFEMWLAEYPVPEEALRPAADF